MFKMQVRKGFVKVISVEYGVVLLQAFVVVCIGLGGFFDIALFEIMGFGLAVVNMFLILVLFKFKLGKAKKKEGKEEEKGVEDTLGFETYGKKEG